MQLVKVVVKTNAVGTLRNLFVKIGYVQMHQLQLLLKVVVELG